MGMGGEQRDILKALEEVLARLGEESNPADDGKAHNIEF